MLRPSGRFERRRMVRVQLAGRDIVNRRVLAAMGAVPREHFVPPAVRDLAYADQPLPIGCDQTISQPYIVALMTQEARVGRHSKVLEIGTGTGYQAAVLAKLARHVWTVERLDRLAHRAAEHLERLRVDNVTIVVGDGAQGHPEHAPYDAILVTAAAPHVPDALRAQLRVGGRLVIPLGNEALQVLYVIERTQAGFDEYSAGSCRFVPLVSPDAFHPSR